MTERTPCSALVNGVCINGFPVMAGCRTGDPRFSHPCLSEKWCARVYPETGAPSADQVARSRARAITNQREPLRFWSHK